jgi:hypothetical protein
MITCDTNSPREFIDQLRKIAELFNRNGIVNEKTLTQATNSLYSAPMLAEVQVRRKESRSTQETSNNVRTNNINRNIVCYYCHIPNHTIRNCNNKIRDEERGIFQTSRPSPSNNQGRNQTQQGRTFVNSSQNQYNGRNFPNNTYPGNNTYNNQQQQQRRPQQLNNNGQQWRSQQQQQWRPQQWNNNGQQQQQFNQQQQQQLSPPNKNMNPMPLMGMNVDPMYNPQTTFQNQNSSDLN